MAVADLIEQTKKPLLARAEELRPAFEEYQDIQRVLEMFEQRGGSRARTSATSGSAGRGRPRNVEGGRKGETLTLIRQRPGVTISEMADAFGIKQNYLYRVTKELEVEGLIRKEGQGFHPAETQPEAAA